MSLIKAPFLWLIFTVVAQYTVLYMMNRQLKYYWNTLFYIIDII